MLEPPYLELQYYVGPRVDEAMKLLTDQNPSEGRRKIVVPGVVGLSKQPEELEYIRRVVVLRTEGEAFCGETRKRRGKLRKRGKTVYERFLEVAELVPCVYAAILVEYSLEEPEELRKDSRSLAFRNFYLSQVDFGTSVLAEVIRLAGAGSYVEKRASGIYISMSAEFNPGGCSVDSIESQERSVRIATVIGKAAK